MPMSMTTTSGLQRFGQRHGLTAVVRLADHGEFRCRSMHQAQAAAHQLVIVGQQNAGLSSSSSGNSATIVVP